MAEDQIFSKKELKFLQELVRQKVDFMIVGLSAAALQGAPVVTQDVDLWFKSLEDPRIRKALDKVDGVYVPPMGQNPPMFSGDAVKLFDIVVHMHGLESFDKEKKHALKISLGKFKVSVLSLERIIKSEKAFGRPKDKVVLPVLSDALKTIRKASPRT